ncbi:G-protein coupled receptor family C group 6 member A-like [Colossoma macropomum]|uniref:G-protein coupled receptor family C group 6 member A-like n=1 Tax=Colossoma macropomum TaxID=42526 RepID=UPI0018652E88|nr:G-protein coupled receptor family C group 6 member A-like [Colossoma macropomum]
MRAGQGVSKLGLMVMLGLWGCINCDIKPSPIGAYAHGDIVIGILGSVHSKVNDLQGRIRPEMFTCTDFDLIPFVQSLAAIHTIEMINDSGFLPGIRLGYAMCDPCVHATQALHCVEHMLSVNGTLPVLSDYSDFRSPVKVFLGERYSELSIPMARLLSIYMIPQISCTSSAPALSDKLRCPSFFRVIPSDVYQTKALAKLMARFSWDWVGVVSLDDDYGKAALENFLLDAEKEHVCAAFQEVVPHYLDNKYTKQRIKEVADHIRSSTAKVVLLILRPEHVEMLFEEMIKTNTSLTWIASDAWSATRNLMKIKNINKVGDIFGFTFVTGKIPGFEDYLQNLRPGRGARNDFIDEYKQMRFNCSPDPLEANDDYLLHAVDVTEAYSQRVAVYAVAHAIKKLLQCNDTACSGDTNLRPWKLVEILHELNFTLDSQTFFFNQFGDFENGYDFIMWKKEGDERVPEVVGKFLIKNGDVEIYDQKILWTNSSVPFSRCSPSCPPGSVKNISNVACCYTCTICNEGTYTDKWDQPTCQKCPNNTWSEKNSTECKQRTVLFLKWNDPYPIALMVGAAIGVLLLLISLILYVWHKRTPVIKKSGFEMSCLMKLGLLISFGSIIAFIGRPNIHLCRAQQIMYGLGFTLCVCCILIKSFCTFLAFLAFDIDKQHKLRKLYKPTLIIILVNAGQGLICAFWLIFASPDIDLPSTQSMFINLMCAEGSIIGFAVMHAYIAVLAFVCFLLAFKSRKVPQDFNETGIIIFSMLIHLFVWLCFIPIYITKNEQRPIVQASAILVSNYGIIFCHFIPKCYQVLWEKTENSLSAIRQRLFAAVKASVPS